MERAMAAVTAQLLAHDSLAIKALPSWLKAFIPDSLVSLPLAQFAATIRSASRLSSVGPPG